MGFNSDWSDYIDAALAKKAAANTAANTPANTNGHHPEPDHPLVKKALELRLSDLSAMPPDSGRNDALNIAAGYLGRFPIDRQQLHDMLIEACRTNGLLDDDGYSKCAATISSGFKKADLDGPRVIEDRPQRGAEPAVTTTEVVEDQFEKSGLGDILELEGDFWQRKSLNNVYTTALARMCSPWAVLAHCTARALTLVRPCIRLPPLIGGPGSLNWFAAIAAKSGGGKGSASAVARELVDATIRERGLGSGEGIIGAYYKPGNNTTPPEVHEAVMFVADEIDTMTALSSRTGTTMMGILRNGFAGETLGFSYIAKGRDVHVDAHTYRMTLVISVQPARAGGLMGDHGGGTPQRFMWFPGNDPRITDTPDSIWTSPLALPPNTEWQYPRTLTIPKEAERLILVERAKSARGEQASIDGHSMFCREKFAFGLAILDGRTQMNSEDWRLSGIAANVSAHTREWITGQLNATAEEEASERGRLQGVAMTATDEEKAYRTDQRTARLSRWALGKLDDGPMTNREIHKAAASRDRPWVDGALTGLMNAGLVDRDDQKRWIKL